MNLLSKVVIEIIPEVQDPETLETVWCISCTWAGTNGKLFHGFGFKFKSSEKPLNTKNITKYSTLILKRCHEQVELLNNQEDL